VTKLHKNSAAANFPNSPLPSTNAPHAGEITLLIGPEAPADARTQANSTQSLADRVEELIRQAKLDRKEALKLAAKERGLTRRAAYDEIVSEKTSLEGTPVSAKSGERARWK